MRFKSFFHKQNTVLDHRHPLLSPPHLSPPPLHFTKFQTERDGLNHFPTHSIRRYSFHHPFLFPSERLIIYSFPRQTRIHFAAAPLTQLQTSLFFFFWPPNQSCCENLRGKKKECVQHSRLSCAALSVEPPTSGSGGGGLFSAAANWLTSG